MEAYKAIAIKLLSHKHARPAALALIGLCGLWFFINFFEVFAIFFYKPPVTTPSSTNSSLQLQQQAQLLTQIPSWHLMGAAPVSVANLANIPISSLNLKLSGIFFQPNTKNSQAMISDANGNTQLYSIGDVVSGGAKLYDILPDSVVLQRGSQLEKLELPNRQLNFGPPPQGLPQN